MYILQKIKYNIDIEQQEKRDYRVQAFPQEIIIRRLKPVSTPKNNSSCLMVDYSINKEELKRNMFEFFSDVENNKEELTEDIKDSIIKYFVDINSFFRKDNTTQVGNAMIKHFENIDKLIKFLDDERKKTKERIELNIPTNQ